jgi:hypothetical protein
MSRKYLSMWWIAAAILGAMLVGRHAHSATIETFAPNDKRSSWIILIDGEIRPDDSLAFKRVVAKNKITEAVVALNSPVHPMRNFTLNRLSNHGSARGA